MDTDLNNWKMLIASLTLLASLLAAAECTTPSTQLGPLDAFLSVARSRAAQHAERVRTGTPVSVITNYGPVSGFTDGIVDQFLNIPFAQPPLGLLRWAPPMPPRAWTSPPNNGTWWGPVCMQDPGNEYWELFSGVSEDCLSLNVYAPHGQPPAGGWPMMLWFYGGSYQFGAGGYPVYDGYFAVNHTRSVMIVTMNYRVSTMGWLASDELRLNASDGSVGNWGLQDMRAALEFLLNTGATFGGNPSKVTIFGESAGAGSVSIFLTSNPRAAGKFQNAIIESGALSDWIVGDYNASVARYPRLAAAAGCPTSGPASLSCLRSVNASALMALGQRVGTDGGSPIVDGVEVVGNPRQNGRAGKFAPGVRVLLGTNADEGGGDLGPAPNMTAAQYTAAVNSDFGALAPAVLALYPVAAFPSPGEAWRRVQSDSGFTCPTRDTARWLSSSSRVGGAAPVYAYFYVSLCGCVGCVRAVTLLTSCLLACTEHACHNQSHTSVSLSSRLHA